jgi:hypothetical protein
MNHLHACMLQHRVPALRHRQLLTRACESAQGIEDHFLEQWHQKLHTNTTPADIAICESYIDFLHSGDGGQFHPITGAPPQLAGAVYHGL